MSNVPGNSSAPSPWSSNPQNAPSGIYPPSDPDPFRAQKGRRASSLVRSPSSAPSPTSSGSSRPPDRPNVPTRSSTVDTPRPDRTVFSFEQTRSEDLNHGGSNSHTAGTSGPSTGKSPTFFPNRSAMSASPKPQDHPSSSGNSEGSNHRLSISSISSANSGSSRQSDAARMGPPSTASTSLVSASCSACGNPMHGAFVRALSTVYHLNCFNCMDCGEVVASKFFPIEGPDGKLSPLCERDYFRRLNLICAKCGTAMRGSYITACNKKFHVEHFTCSLCSTLFGPQDSYYEHDGDVYCHFHYSTRFATKCAGCSSAILKQFVEINRNMRDECWHPECYMIHKFWNVKVVSRRPTSSASVDDLTDEQHQTPASLKEKQLAMEQEVYRIWTVLSAFEESSAACISDMLRQVSNGQYLEAIRMAEKFILHVEVLFATIDDLEYHFARLNAKGMSHVREARMLCRKTVDLFTLLSHTQETGERRMGMTQELLALVTGLAHYLKILIRIALTGALKLEREHCVQEAMTSFLDKLHLLAVQGGNPSARRMLRGVNGAVLSSNQTGNFGTQGVTYGFRSLAPENAGDSPFALNVPKDGNTVKISVNSPPSDLCAKCAITVEEDCVRLGTYQRWHSYCVQCETCRKIAVSPIKTPLEDKDNREKDKESTKISTARRPPANVDDFCYEVDPRKEGGDIPAVVFCTDHAHPGCRTGFQAVSRLEQYAFLLNVALRRLYLLLKKQGVVPLSPANASGQLLSAANTDPYRNPGDIMTMKSVHLDRQLSATTRLPKRSTVVESPAGKHAHPSDALHSPRSQGLEFLQQHRSAPQISQASQGQQGQQSSRLPSHSPTLSPPQQPSSRLQHEGQSGTPTAHFRGQILRPSFSRNNTEGDESVLRSPAGGLYEPRIPPVDNSITLADIPHLMEAAQAREQQRSLPRENSIPCIAELSSLELAIVKHCAVLALHRSPLKDQFDLDEILELLEAKKGGFWNKLFKPGNNRNNPKKKGVFGVPLELLVEREGVDSLLGASRTPLRIPSFIDDVISAMKQMDMSVEGIFRKNGNIRRLKELTDAIDRDAAAVDLTQDNPVQLAALLKKFLRDLPDPLLTFKLHRLFVASQGLPQEEERQRLLHMMSLILPKSHRDTMEVLFVFLKWVASFAHMDETTGSKMDLGNLATVICPSILYSRARDAARDESFGAIRVVTSLLELQDIFFTVPDEFLPILHDQEYFSSSLEMSSKDFMKKCDTYMRLKSNGRQLPFNNSNSSTPRYPPPNSPNPDRSLIGASSSERNMRAPNPSGALPSQTPSSSPALPQSTTMAAARPPSRSPQTEESPATPRPKNPNVSPPSRPSSYVQPKQSGEHPHPLPENGNQLQGARQRP